MKQVLLQHMQENRKEYIIAILILLTGLIFGVMMINNVNQNQEEQITSYLGAFLAALKEEHQINRFALLKNSILNNLILATALWFVGLAVIGIPLVFGIIFLKGFSLGYAIASVIAMLGAAKGMTFSIFGLFLQNMITIPCVLAIGVSGMKLYKSITKGYRKENIKTEIYRHTIFSCFIFILLCVSSLIEAYLSTVLLELIIPYF